MGRGVTRLLGRRIPALGGREGSAPALHLSPELLHQVGVAGLHLLGQLLTSLEMRIDNK